MFIIDDMTLRILQQRRMDVVQYLVEFEVVVCTQCRYALSKGHGITRHLVATHSWPRNEAKEVASRFVGKVIRSPSDKPCLWIVPKPQSPPVPYLNLCQTGFGCHACAYVCRSKAVMWNHYSNEHRDQFAESPARLWRKDVCVQSFSLGTNSQCFEVTIPTAPTVTIAAAAATAIAGNAVYMTPSAINDVAATLRAKLHMQVGQRTERIQQSRTLIETAKNAREVNPWLDRTKWVKHLQGQDLVQMAKLAAMPAIKETELNEICVAFKRMMHKTRQLIRDQKINHFDLKSINSFTRHQDFQRPFNIAELQEPTFNHYISIWQRLLCYLIRTSDPSDGLVHLAPVLYRLTHNQRLCLRELVDTAHIVTVIPQFDVAYRPATKTLEKVCIRMAIRLLDHALDGPSEYESVIVSFLSVAGICVKTNGFKDISGCTSQLSAMIKIAQLVVLCQGVYDVEARRVDYLNDSIHEMRSRFMTYDGRTPMGWMHGLRAFGKKLVQDRTMDGAIIWSSDGEIITYKEFESKMDNIKYFVMALVDKAKSRLGDLFLVQDGETFSTLVPPVRLHAIKDNPSESQAGWSFLNDGRNEHLFDGSGWMIDRITGSQKLLMRFLKNSVEVSWIAKSVEEYLSAISRFLETLWLLVHITSGQPARVSEELGIRYCNTMQGEHRNMFIEFGLVSITLLYHKGYSMQGTTKITH